MSQAAPVPRPPQPVPRPPSPRPPVPPLPGPAPHPVPDPLEGGGTVAVDDAVAEALRVLEGLPDRPVHEHVAVFEAVHAALQDRLVDQERG